MEESVEVTKYNTNSSTSRAGWRSPGRLTGTASHRQLYSLNDIDNAHPNAPSSESNSHRSVQRTAFAIKGYSRRFR